MTNEEMFIKNHMLHTEFALYLVEHPQMGKKIPPESIVVLLPDNDPELCEKNIKIARQNGEAGQSIVYVHIKKVRPPRSRIVEPTLAVGQS